VVDIYRDANRRGIYPPLFTDPEYLSTKIKYLTLTNVCNRTGQIGQFASETAN